MEYSLLGLAPPLFFVKPSLVLKCPVKGLLGAREPETGSLCIDYITNYLTLHIWNLTWQASN